MPTHNTGPCVLRNKAIPKHGQSHRPYHKHATSAKPPPSTQNSAGPISDLKSNLKLPLSARAFKKNRFTPAARVCLRRPQVPAGLRQQHVGRRPSLSLAPTPVGAERGGTADLPPEALRSHHRCASQPPLAAGPGAHTIQGRRAGLPSSSR